LQEDDSVVMAYRLVIQILFQPLEQRIELLRLDDRPRNDSDLILVQFCNEVSPLFHLYNLLEFELESVRSQQRFVYMEWHSLLLDIVLIGLDNILQVGQQHAREVNVRAELDDDHQLRAK
jgi:hypothetical protein